MYRRSMAQILTPFCEPPFQYLAPRSTLKPCQEAISALSNPVAWIECVPGSVPYLGVYKSWMTRDT